MKSSNSQVNPLALPVLSELMTIQTKYQKQSQKPVNHFKVRSQSLVNYFDTARVAKGI